MKGAARMEEEQVDALTQIALTQTKLQQVASNLTRGVEAHKTAVEGKVAGDAVPCMPETSAQLGESPV